MKFNKIKKIFFQISSQNLSTFIVTFTYKSIIRDANYLNKKKIKKKPKVHSRFFETLLYIFRQQRQRPVIISVFPSLFIRNVILFLELCAKKQKYSLS